MTEHRLTIQRAENGFEVEVRDPKIVARNNKSDGSYQDPDRSYVFETRDTMVAWVTENLDDLLPKVSEDEYTKVFNATTKEESDK